MHSFIGIALSADQVCFHFVSLICSMSAFSFNNHCFHSLQSVWILHFVTFFCSISATFSSIIDVILVSQSQSFILSHSCAQHLHSLALIIVFILFRRFEFFISSHSWAHYLLFLSLIIDVILFRAFEFFNLSHLSAQCLHSLSSIIDFILCSRSLNFICLIHLLTVCILFQQLLISSSSAGLHSSFVPVNCSITAFSFKNLWYHFP